MYTHCLACGRSLGRNQELTHLPIGKRIAFDAEVGRVWVICRRCGQWNLLPLEERWEALEECARVAGGAESRAASDGVGFARTVGGLELLEATKSTRADIANERFGRRIRNRQVVMWWTAGGLAALAGIAGVGAASVSGSAYAGTHLAVIIGAWFWYLWRTPRRLWAKAATSATASARIWGWRLGQMRIQRARKAERPSLVLPLGRGETMLDGLDAARALASLLRQVNDADCAHASVARAMERVAAAERPRGGKRPWERIAEGMEGRPLLAVEPEQRLALEMAVTEELERADLAALASGSRGEWEAEEEIGAIADDLLVPAAIRERLREASRRRGH